MGRFRTPLWTQPMRHCRWCLLWVWFCFYVTNTSQVRWNLLYMRIYVADSLVYRQSIRSSEKFCCSKIYTFSFRKKNLCRDSSVHFEHTPLWLYVQARDPKQQLLSGLEESPYQQDIRIQRGWMTSTLARGTACVSYSILHEVELMRSGSKWNVQMQRAGEGWWLEVTKTRQSKEKANKIWNKSKGTHKIWIRLVRQCHSKLNSSIPRNY